MKNAKTIISVLLTVSLLLACAGCGAGSSSGQTASQERLEIISPDEYVLYQNVFYKDYGKELDGTQVKKEGVLAVLNDAFNDTQRYYVWGYYDQTKCCDWQWEFVPQEGAALPPVGSLVSVTGTFTSDEDALDGYWITNASISPKTAYEGAASDLDMYAMSCTLERVQMLNIIHQSEAFQDRAFTAYGRIASPDSLEDPYYDGSWNINFSWDGEIPGIGTLVAMSGTVRDGVLVAEAVKTIS